LYCILYKGFLRAAKSPENDITPTANISVSRAVLDADPGQQQLNLAQPSLSKQLAGLEESVGARLFDRAHNGMVLTDAGRVLLRHAQRVLGEIDEAEAGLREFAAGKRAIIRVAGVKSAIKAVLPAALILCSAQRASPTRRASEPRCERMGLWPSVDSPGCGQTFAMKRWKKGEPR
jgi:hypothetical protein